MLLFRLFGASSLLCFCFCDQRLLVDQLRWDFLELENELWNFSGNNLLYKPQEAAEIYLAKKFYDFDKKLVEMPEDLLYGVSPLRAIPEFLFFYTELNVIKITYEKFRNYQTEVLGGIQESKKKISMEDLIYDITNNKTGAKETMERAYRLAKEITTKGYNWIHGENYWCKNLNQSPQQVLFNLYNLISLNGLKAYVLQQFAHLGTHLWERDDRINISITTRKNYERTVKMSNQSFELKTYPNDIWKCDPETFKKGQNYDEFTRLLQGHIQNEVDMSSRRTCRETCSEYSFTKSHGCYDYKSDFCKKVERCNGNIIGCFFVESDASICVSSSLYRRYDYVKYNSGKTYGKNKSCPNRKIVDSWTRWFVRCHYCMCLCDEEGRLSDRYINLRPVMADVKNNRVVTGMRLIKHNRILHLQIQEGKLLPYGYINQSTVHWVNVENYAITTKDMKEGRDFFKMKYGERSMALDQIKVNDENHVITGMHFAKINSKIQIKIHVSPFNWHTGKLHPEGGYDIYETSTNGKREKLIIENPDVPTSTQAPSRMFQSDGLTYVEFTHSDFGKDAAQTTIPFIDIQEVINEPAVPLIGAGIYYKGNPGYGGFIAPRIKTYDYGVHASSNLPKMHDRSTKKDNELVDAS